MSEATIFGYNFIKEKALNQCKESTAVTFSLLACKICGKGTFLQIWSQIINIVPYVRLLDTITQCLVRVYFASIFSHNNMYTRSSQGVNGQ